MTDKGIIARFANNPIATRLLLALLLGGGLISVSNLSIQAFPDADLGLVTVTVEYPGATPAEVDEEVNQRLVQPIRDVEGVDVVLSSAYENFGLVYARLKNFADPDEALDRIKTAVQGVPSFPPPLARMPTIELVPAHRSIATLAVVSETASEIDLRRAAELLREELLALPGVSLVLLYGVRDYEVAIEITEEALLRNGLTMDQVAAAVGRSSRNLAAGELRTASGGLLVHAASKRDRAEEFEDIVVLAQEDGTLLRLGDIASVRDGFEDVELLSELDGRPAAFVRIWESSVGKPRVIETAAEVLQLAADHELPQGMELVVWEDRTNSIKEPLAELVGSALLGLALVFAFLVAVFDLRLATWIALGIPVSFLGAFILFDAVGANINIMTLFALFLVIGIVVDDAVVVGESIARVREDLGPGIDASIAGARTVVGPVTVGVLTTMIAFTPLFFLPGVLDDMVGDLPVVVILVLAVSLVEAFVLLPAHLAHGRAWSLAPLAAIETRVNAWLSRFRDDHVVRAVSVGVRRPWTVLAMGGGFLALTAILPATGAVGFVFLDSFDDADRLQVDVTMPAGTPFHATEGAARSVLAAVRHLETKTGRELVRSAAVHVGSQPKAFIEHWRLDVAEFGSHLAAVSVRFRKEALDAMTLSRLKDLLRRNVGELAGAKRVEMHSSSLKTPPEIDYFLIHADPDVLAEAADELAEAYRDIPALHSIVLPETRGKRRFDVELNAVGETLGLTPGGTTGQLRDSFFGVEVQRVQWGRDDVKVMVRYPPERRRDLADLLDELVVRGQGGARVPLRAVADVVETDAPAVVSRYDGLLAARLQAQVDPRIETAGEVTRHLEQDVWPALAERHPGLGLALGGQFVIRDEFASMLLVLGPIALLLIYGLIAVQLQSYLQPLIVLVGMPFGVAGAVLGHAALGYDMTSNSIFGMVAVCGVVVNDTVVLLDRYNKIDPEGRMPAVAVAAAAVRHRFRAVFLTTATTTLGLLPILYDTTAVSRGLAPLVLSIMAGLLVASAVLLLVVPALLLLIENVRDRFRPAGGREVAMTPH